MKNGFNEVYPRPQLKKEHYQILHDNWTMNGEKINVPYPPQAKLSGYGGEVPRQMVYINKCHLTNEIKRLLFPDDTYKTKRGHLLLHFGAVDQIAYIYVDDMCAGYHEGGYVPFTLDITNLVSSGHFELCVEAVDELDPRYPYGKQCKEHGGMWYTPVSGIWQTVWCEWVPDTYIKRVKLETTCSSVKAAIYIAGKTDTAEETEAVLSLQMDGHDYHFTTTHRRAAIDFASLTDPDGKPVKPILWSCENPHLYSMSIAYGDDRAEVYFGLRTVTIEERGHYKRICINREPVFLNGVLDQGYFEDGLFLPDSPMEYEKDILRMKELGFNMLRKHIKVEPDLFYYACDKLGMYVLQDMVNNGPYRFWSDTALPTVGIKKRKDSGRYRDALQKIQFVDMARATQDLLYDHPCVIGYTVFNEGWGQTDSDEIGDGLKARDPSRFYDYTSGWFWQKNSDVDSLHIYFRTKKLSAKDKPMLLSEFGGFSREVEDHVSSRKKSYGYGACKDEEELTERIVTTYEKMVIPAVERGLCGAVYTQISDIEDEINGFYTYDRQVCKVDKKRIRSVMDRLVNK